MADDRMKNDDRDMNLGGAGSNRAILANRLLDAIRRTINRPANAAAASRVEARTNHATRMISDSRQDRRPGWPGRSRTR
jgi:hypothetical protein